MKLTLSPKMYQRGTYISSDTAFEAGKRVQLEHDQDACESCQLEPEPDIDQKISDLIGKIVREGNEPKPE